MQKNEIVTLSQKEHVLKRPGLYLGSINAVEEDGFLYNSESDKFEFVSYEYVPALVKVIREVIDNSIDEGLRTNWRFANKITVDISESGPIKIRDNGRGIPYKKNSNGDTSAKIAWCDLNSGSNFEDKEDNVTLGQNGVGSSLSHIFSLKFEGQTCDGKKKVVIKSKNNMNNISQKISDGKHKFTQVTFTPDYERFGVKGLGDIEQKILFSDLIVLMQIYPKLNIVLNGNTLKRKSFKDFSSYFTDSAEILEKDGIKIAIFPNQQDDFNFLHSVNGLKVSQGGTPLNWVMSNVVKELKDLLPKKYSTIKVGDLKNKVSAIILFTKMNNPRFNSQTKEKCINTHKEFSQSIGDVDFKTLARKIKRNQDIMKPITLLHSIKEKFNSLSELKDLKPTKKRTFIEKFYKSTQPINESALVLTEGDSALSGVMSALGRDGYSYFPLKGKPLNIREQTPKAIQNNQEIKSILQILDVDITSKSKAMNHKSIIIATDADPDGSHICGLVLNIFQKFYPEIVRDGRVSILRTPMMVLKPKKKGKKEVLLYDFKDMFAWQEKNDINDYVGNYYKGLGGWKDEDLRALFKQKGLDSFIIPFSYEEDIDELFDSWFNKDESDFRKDQIREIQFNIEKA